jgi:hypothetical protein
LPQTFVELQPPLQLLPLQHAQPMHPEQHPHGSG